MIEVSFASTLKHEQLGLDKYQSGRITILYPNKNRLTSDIHEGLEKVSKEAMPNPVATYLQMVNEICREKVLHSPSQRASTPHAEQGLFTPPKPATVESAAPPELQSNHLRQSR